MLSITQFMQQLPQLIQQSTQTNANANINLLSNTLTNIPPPPTPPPLAANQTPAHSNLPPNQINLLTPTPAGDDPNPANWPIDWTIAQLNYRTQAWEELEHRWRAMATTLTIYFTRLEASTATTRVET